MRQGAHQRAARAGSTPRLQQGADGSGTLSVAFGNCIACTFVAGKCAMSTSRTYQVYSADGAGIIGPYIAAKQCARSAVAADPPELREVASMRLAATIADRDTSSTLHA